MNVLKIRVRHTQNHWLTVRTGLQDSVQKPLSNSITDYPVKVTHVVKKSSKSVIEMRVLETNQEFKFLEECVESINTRLIALVSLDGIDWDFMHARALLIVTLSFLVACNRHSIIIRCLTILHFSLRVCSYFP